MLKTNDGPVSDGMGINPFIGNLSIYVTRRKQGVINKFGDEDIKEYDLEVMPYTKVFDIAGDVKQICELPIRSQQMYLYLIHSLKSAQDYVCIDRVKYMKQMKIGSVNTFKVAIRGLSSGSYIYPHYKIRDVYWINPHYFFRGSRINKYPDNLVEK